jgi:Protein of unknown function (DUF3987)
MGPRSAEKDELMPDTIEPNAAQTGSAWPETDPSLLEEGRPSLPDFPLQTLPPWWRAWVSETAQGAGAPVDYVVQALLASVAGVCGAGVVAQITDSWSEPMILWQALVGGPSHGKTPALEALRRPLAAVEITAGREGRGPVVVDQATALPSLLAAATKRPAGALLWRDEPAAWLAALGCNGRGEPRHLSALLDTWSPLRTALGPGSPTLSIIGCLDPARLPIALSGSDDGRAARFLYAWPRPAPYRSFLELPACRESDVVNALQHIARFAGDPARPLVLKLHDSALRGFDIHLARLHADLQRCDGVEAAWLGKGRGTVVRLALALALLNQAADASPATPPPGIIIGDTLSAACSLWDYFRAHARAVLARAFPSDGERLMRLVLGWIRARGVRQISREDVRRGALGQTLNAHHSLQVIQSLERAGFLRKVVHEPDGAGRPPLRWDVNPALIGGSLAEIAEIPPPPVAVL